MIPVLIALLIYSTLHSTLASNKAKQSIHDRVGPRAYEGLYRSAYNVFAAISFIPVLLLLTLSPNSTVWRLSAIWNVPLLIIRTTGITGFCIALVQTDLARFAGLTQILAYFRHKPLPLPVEELKTTGLYSRSRHPLYLFSILILWSVPVMTDTYLAFCIGTTLYFIIGSWYEERRMLVTFGGAYRRYQSEVPWLFTLPRRRKYN